MQKVLAAYEQAVADADADAKDRGETPRTASKSRDQAARQQDERPASRRAGRKPVRAGYPIDDYAHDALVQLIRWLESDDVLRTEDELLAATIAELGFHRRGAKIVAAIRRAIEEARR